MRLATGCWLDPERNYGDATADAIDAEVRATVDAAFERAISLLTNRRELLERTARLLLEQGDTRREGLDCSAVGRPTS